MKRSIALALAAASLSVLTVSAYADGAPHYPTSLGTSAAASYVSSDYQGSSLTRAQVKADLVQSERNGSLARLDQSTYVGH